MKSLATRGTYWLLLLLLITLATQAWAAPPVDLRVGSDSNGPVTVDVGEAVTFSVQAMNCPRGNNSLFSDNWRDDWFLDGSPILSGSFPTAPCDRSVQYTSQAFSAVGTYTFQYSTEYCSDGNFLFCTQRTTFGSDQITINVVDPNSGLTCFNDDFVASSLNADDWVTSVSRGPFTPSVVGNRLRMTEARGNQATAATLQREMPGADNLVVLEFDYYAYGGNGADGLAVVLSDATITPQPGSFGGSLGYAQRNTGDPGFAGGWIGIGLDEYGNFSNSNEGRQGGPGFQKDAIAIRGAYQGGYRYLEGTQTLLPGIDQSGNNPSAHRYRITVDSRAAGHADVLVERDITGTGNNFQTLIPSFNALAKQGQPSVPENFLLSFTGSTGGSTNIHELGNLQLCALKLNKVGKQVDHFEILHDGVALTCQPETVTIRACSNAACNPLFTDPVTATLAPANGWGANPVTISGGTGSATLQKTTAGKVTLGVVGSQPSTRPQSVTLCGTGSGALSAANCSLEFHDTGLAFDVPDMISHKPVTSVQIKAVRKDQQTQACVPAFANVQKPVRFWSDYVNPNASGRPVSRPVSVNSTAVGTDQSTAKILNLNFDGTGTAQVDVLYPDAGMLNLNALYLGSASTNDAGLAMPGADSFVSIPAGFCVTSVGECAAGNATCSKFVRAGESFNLDITAVGWQKDADADMCQGNPVTPNFALSDIPLRHSLVEPGGGTAGNISPASYSHNRSLSATQTVPASVSEVGVFKFRVDPAPSTYLGKTIPGGESLPIGRFYPDSFKVMTDPGEFEPECSSGTADAFVYTGQPFGWKMVPMLNIEPVSVQGTRTKNYTEPGFQKLSASNILRVAPTQDKTAVDQASVAMKLQAASSAGTLSVLNPGLLGYTYAIADTFTYLKDPKSQIGPFTPDAEFTVSSITDSDGVNASAAPYKFVPAAAFKIRFGRMVMENVYGPETIPALSMPFRLEYWNGSAFMINAADSCTSWDTSAITGTTNHYSLDTSVPATGSFAAGKAPPLSLAPKGSMGTDRLIWNVATWLNYDWNGDGTEEAPGALATFGVYRGHDRVIYWHEVR